ncbi:aminomethyltransferase family protein [Halovivax cerinus]|uniref:Aminomethyltransferase family protein n=1 Tax=Halovivax cerinus TaxID=1487865 RepID=A0ABD5NT17_9EURY|nr:aminomethyltransferase family protein [Halovivax cerinus]
MTSIESVHADHGATFDERGRRTVVSHYGRPDRAHRAVRNGVGLIEPAYGIVTVAGDDRVEYVDNVVTNDVPTTDGTGRYALLLDPQGRIETDLYVYDAGDRLLCVTPPGRAGPLAEEWAEKVFIQDVEIDHATDEFAIFGVHGPQATEKVASVLGGSATPDEPLTFVRGTIADAGVTVTRTDGLAGEEGYEVVCAVEHAESVYEALSVTGMGAAPFGYRTWESLTLEAGTPLFETELEGTIPNVLGLRNALDFEKGCYVGQEVVSRVENRGQPSRRLIGLVVSASDTPDPSDSTADEQDIADERPVPEVGAAVFDGDTAVGAVTRAAVSPSLDRTVALALVEYDLDVTDLTVRVDGSERPAERRPLPLVEGSASSARRPTYP